MKKGICWVLVLILLSMTTVAFAGRKNAYREVLDEGFVYEGEGYTMTVRWCEDGEAKLFGRLWLPGEMDENGKYTAIVMCHGHMGNCDFWDKYFGPAMAKKGYVCYAIDCRSSYDGQRDYSTPNEDHVATVDTYARDLIAATEFVRSLPYVDLNNVYLSGQSMGCMAAQVAGSRIPEKVAGLLLLYGFVDENSGEMMGDCYKEVTEHPYNNGEVLMMGGDIDAACSYEKIAFSMNLYEKSTFVLISDARHGFGKEDARPEQISAGAMDDFLQRVKR